jgi:hypothetical protein
MPEPEESPMPSDRSPLTVRRRPGRVRARLEEMPFRTAVAVLAGVLAVLAVTVSALVLIGHGGGAAKSRQWLGGAMPLVGPSRPSRAAQTASPSVQPGTPGPGLRRGSRGPTAAPSGPAAPPRVALAVSARLALTGQDVTYSVTISPAAADGTVAFADGGKAIAGCGRIAVVAGTAWCQISYSQAGIHTITAVYHASNGNAYRAPAVNETIVKCGRAFQGCDLSGLNLANAGLQGADLQGANLQNADLAGADLAAADLTGANLQNADLAGADLTGAIAKGANLNGALWSGTTCPDGTSSDADGRTCQKNLSLTP